MTTDIDTNKINKEIADWLNCPDWMSDPKPQRPYKTNSYEEQRAERLYESIGEYLDDDGCSPEVFLNDLREGLKEGRKYFYGRVAAYDHVLGAIQP